MTVLLSPSILTADFGRLAEEVASVSPFVDWYHLDVMDGHYVPNLTFGPSVVAAVREAVTQPLHVHLMIEDPLSYARAFVEAGADRISFHPEVVPDTAKVIEHIRGLGAGAGIAVHPDRDLEAATRHLGDLDVILVMTVRPGFGGQAFLHEVVPKISAVRRLVEENGSSADIEVDGGVNPSTIGEAVGAGAGVIVAGSAIFDGIDPPAAAKRLRDQLQRLHTDQKGVP